MVLYNRLNSRYNYFLIFDLHRSKNSSRSSTPPLSFTECQKRSSGEHEEGSEMFEEPVEEMVSDLSHPTSVYIQGADKII